MSTYTIDADDFMIGEKSAKDFARMGHTEALAGNHKALIRAAERILNAANAESRNLTAFENVEYEKLSAQLTRSAELISQSRINGDRTSRLLHGDSNQDSQNFESPEWRAIKAGQATRFELPIAKSLKSISERRDLRSTEYRDLLTTNVSSVPTTVFQELVMRMVQKSGVLSSNPRTFDTGPSGNPIRVPTLTAYGTASVIAEGSAINESDSTFSYVTLGAYKYSNILQVSAELLSDTEFDLASYLGRELGTRIGISLGAALITGAGTAGPEGIMSASAVTGVTGGTAAPTIANVMSLYASLPTQYRPNSSWVMHPDTLATIISLNDTTNRSIVLNDLSLSTPNTLLGQPVFLDSNVATAGSGNKIVWLGDMNEYLFVRYAGGVSIDVSSDFSFDQDLVSYRSKLRVDSKVVNTDAARVLVGG